MISNKQYKEHWDRLLEIVSVLVREIPNDHTRINLQILGNELNTDIDSIPDQDLDYSLKNQS